MSVLFFKISGSNAQGTDATNDVTTDSFEFKSSHDWSVSIPGDSITGGPPTYTVEVSNDDSTWYDYNNSSTDIDVVDAVADHYFSFRYMRVNYSANGTSAGTVDMRLSIKNDKDD